MSVIIIGSGDGRAALRRFEAAQNDPTVAQPFFTAVQANNINSHIADLVKLADDYGCPEDPCPE